MELPADFAGALGFFFHAIYTFSLMEKGGIVMDFIFCCMSIIVFLLLEIIYTTHER